MRNEGEKEKRSAAGTSVVAAFFLTGLKLVVGLMTGSLGILAEAAHSGLDLVAALITFLAVSISGKPADHEHTYGHGRVENFSALVETGLLFVTCAWIIYEAVGRIFFRARHVDPSLWAFLVMAVSIAVDISRSRILYRAARKYHSQALEADALHFSTDVWSSLVVIVGLALVWLGQNALPRWTRVLEKADAVAALGVALIVLFVSYKLGRRTIEVLLDRAPEGMPQRFAEIAGGVEGVLQVGQVRVRRSGAHLFVDMNVEVDRDLSVERTHAIAEAVEASIERFSPGADVVVHTDPREASRENKAKRIRAIAHRNQMAVHNVRVQEDGGGLIVDLHLEVDDHLSLQQAHDMASHIEADIRADMPEVLRINTHIESRGTGIGGGREVTAGEKDLVALIRKTVDRILGRASCHDVSLYRRESMLIVSLHCSLEKDLPIDQAHALTSRVEEVLKKKIPSLSHVLIHAEPDDH